MSRFSELWITTLYEINRLARIRVGILLPAGVAEASMPIKHFWKIDAKQVIQPAYTGQYHVSIKSHRQSKKTKTHPPLANAAAYQCPTSTPPVN